MHDVVFQIALVWAVVLVGTLAVFALRARDIVARTLALEALALIFVAALALVGVRRDQPGYLDVALVIALLGFVQTVATARYAERRGGNG